MGSRNSKPVEAIQVCPRRSRIHGAIRTLVYLTESSAQTDPVKVFAVASLVEKVIQTETGAFQPPVVQGIYDYNDGVDDTSVFSDVTSLPGDISIYNHLPMCNRVRVANGSCGMSPDSAFFSSNTLSEASVHNKVSERGIEVTKEAESFTL